MPWKECHVMDERLRFVARLLDGEKMAAVCADFGISRKSFYKWERRHSSTTASVRTSAAFGGRRDRATRPAELSPKSGGRTQGPC